MQQDTVSVWDPWVRVFHWSLVVTFFVAYFTEDLLTLHVWFGYAVMGLVAFRIIWGFAGSPYARFSDFVYPPRAVFAYLRELVRLRAPRYLGHTPAGGMMILAMLAVLITVGISGLMVYGAEQQAGPLAGMLAGQGHDWAEQVEEVHEFFANLMMLLVVLHITAVLLTSVLHGENLARAMFTGVKRRELK